MLPACCAPRFLGRSLYMTGPSAQEELRTELLSLARLGAEVEAYSQALKQLGQTYHPTMQPTNFGQRLTEQAQDHLRHHP